MKTKNLILSLLLVSSSAFARMGESPAKCESRYGKPTSSTLKGGSKKMLPASAEDYTNTYKAGTIYMEITFNKSKAVKIHYSELPKDRFDEVLKNNIGITLEEYKSSEKKLEDYTRMSKWTCAKFYRF